MKTKYEIYLACIIFCVADNVQAALYVVVFFNKVSIIEWSYKRFFKFPWFSEWKLLKLYVCQALQFTTILPTLTFLDIFPLSRSITGGLCKNSFKLQGDYKRLRL